LYPLFLCVKFLPLNIISKTDLPHILRHTS
jgi:hypothetical protein